MDKYLCMCMYIYRYMLCLVCLSCLDKFINTAIEKISLIFFFLSFSPSLFLNFQDLDFLVPKAGFFCPICSLFYSDEKAMTNHCKSTRHKQNTEVSFLFFTLHRIFRCCYYSQSTEVSLQNVHSFPFKTTF